MRQEWIPRGKLRVRGKTMIINFGCGSRGIAVPRAGITRGARTPTRTRRLPPAASSGAGWRTLPHHEQQTVELRDEDGCGHGRGLGNRPRGGSGAVRQPWSVALAGRRPEPLAETAALAGPEARVITVPADVSRPDDVDALFSSVRECFGRLDLLFNNAGTFGPRAVPVEDLAYDDWRTVVDVNLTGAFLCAQAAYRQMKEQDPQGGRIINNGSVSAHAPRPHSVAYTATKHAMTGLTKSLSLDGRPYRIACGQIDIGNAATEMTERMRTGTLQANGELAVEPVMAASDVARTVVHMAELPLEANVQFTTVMATGMPYVGRG